jgi:hypothetical protein
MTTRISFRLDLDVSLNSCSPRSYERKVTRLLEGAIKGGLLSDLMGVALVGQQISSAHRTAPESAGLSALCAQTNTAGGDWAESQGPTTGVGTERWFIHSDGRQAYTCDDGGEVRVELYEAEAGGRAA